MILQRVMRPATYCVAITLFVTALGGCATRRDHTALLAGIRTKQMTLEPLNTRAPLLTLRVPASFERDWTKNSANDRFIIFDPDDSGDVQRGMLIVNVTSSVFNHIHDSLETDHSRSTIAGETVEWRERVFTNDDGIVLHQREALLKGAFDLYTDPKSQQALVLQVFVVGTDSILVERLMGSAETIVVGGGRPDA